MSTGAKLYWLVLSHPLWQVLFVKSVYGMAMNYFHCIHRDFINQEIFAKLILFNFISLIVSCVDIPSNNTKYVYQVSFSDAIYKCRQFLLTKMKNSTILNLLLRDLTPIRPNRSFQRNIQSQCLKSLQNRTFVLLVPLSCPRLLK